MGSKEDKIDKKAETEIERPSGLKKPFTRPVSSAQDKRQSGLTTVVITNARSDEDHTSGLIYGTQITSPPRHKTIRAHENKMATVNAISPVQQQGVYGSSTTTRNPTAQAATWGRKSAGKGDFSNNLTGKRPQTASAGLTQNYSSSLPTKSPLSPSLTSRLRMDSGTIGRPINCDINTLFKTMQRPATTTSRTKPVTAPPDIPKQAKSATTISGTIKPPNAQTTTGLRKGRGLPIPKKLPPCKYPSSPAPPPPVQHDQQFDKDSYRQVSQTLYHAVKRGDIPTVEELLNKDKCHIDMTWYNENLLVTAIRNRQEEMALYLIDNGIDPNFETVRLVFTGLSKDNDESGAKNVEVYRISCRQIAYDSDLPVIVDAIDKCNKNVTHSVVQVRERSAERKPRIIKPVFTGPFDLPLLFADTDDSKKDISEGSGIQETITEAAAECAETSKTELEEAKDTEIVPEHKPHHCDYMKDVLKEYEEKVLTTKLISENNESATVVKPSVSGLFAAEKSRAVIVAKKSFTPPPSPKPLTIRRVRNICPWKEDSDIGTVQLESFKPELKTSIPKPPIKPKPTSAHVALHLHRNGEIEDPEEEKRVVRRTTPTYSPQSAHNTSSQQDYDQKITDV